MLKGVFILLGALLLIILSPFVISSAHDARVTTFEQSYSEVSTPAAVTSANITLSYDLYADAVANVVSSTSNITGDTPSASAYVSVSRQLTVSGLASNTSRTLTVDYEIADPALAELPTIDAILLVAVFLYFIAILGLIAGAIYSYFRQ